MNGDNVSKKLKKKNQSVSTKLRTTSAFLNSARLEEGKRRVRSEVSSKVSGGRNVSASIEGKFESSAS